MLEKLRVKVNALTVRVLLWVAGFVLNSEGRRLLADRRGAGALNLIGGFIGLCIAGYVFAYTVPPALILIGTASTWTNAGSAVTALGQIVVPIVFIAGCIFMILKAVGMD